MEDIKRELMTYKAGKYAKRAEQIQDMKGTIT